MKTNPAIRAIAAAAAENDYRMSSLIVGVVTSDAFRMKQAPAATGRPRSAATDAPEAR